MTGSEAIRRGVKQGVDDARMSAMMRELVDKIGANPGDLLQRLELVEAKVINHGGTLETHETRLERHRIRIRWLERLVHLFHGWRANPGL